jgi:hypothetical protein
MASRGSEFDVPVEFGGVSIGEATARLGVKIDRSVCNVVTADEIFCGHRLTGRVVLGNGDNEGQGRLIEDLDESVDGVFDVKRFSANQKAISTGLTFSLADIDIGQLARFSKGTGRLIVEQVAELPEDADDDDDGLSDEAPGTLRANGPWRDVSLGTLFHGALLKSLNKADLETVGDLADFTASDKRLTDLEGIGEGKAAQIEERMLQFWRDNPSADEAVEAHKSNGHTANGSWRSAPLSELGLTATLNEQFAEMKVTTIGGLVELQQAISESKAVWPKGVGPAKAEDIAKRLEAYRERHEQPTAA